MRRRSTLCGKFNDGANCNSLIPAPVGIRDRFPPTILYIAPGHVPLKDVYCAERPKLRCFVASGFASGQWLVLSVIAVQSR